MFLGMKISNGEIARESFCSEGAVRKAIERGTLDVEKLGSVFDYVFKMRVKWLGWGAVEACAGKKAVFPKTVTAENIEDVVEELHYVPDGCHTEGEW